MDKPTPSSEIKMGLMLFCCTLLKTYNCSVVTATT